MTELLLKWEKNGLGSGMHSMLKSRELVDVTIVCQGEIIQAHKTVLAACSQHFKRTFMINPCQHPIVIMQDVQLVHLRALIDFMYKGETKVKQKDMKRFMRTAEALKVSGLASNSDTSDEETQLYDLFEEEDEAAENFSKKFSQRHTSGESSQYVEPTGEGDVHSNDHDNSQGSEGNGAGAGNTQSTPAAADHASTGEFLQTWSEEVVAAEMQTEVQAAVTNIVVTASMLDQQNQSTSEVAVVSEAELASALIKSDFVAPSAVDPLSIDMAALRKKKKKQVTQTILNPTAVTLMAQKQERLPCPLCHLQFTTERYRDRHVRNTHTPGGTQQWTCAFCKKTLKNKDKLETHMRLFHMSKMVDSRYQCSICNKSYKSRAVLIKHQKHTHENYKANVLCPLCQKHFNYVDTMRAHMRKAHNYYSRPNCRKGKEGETSATK